MRNFLQRQISTQISFIVTFCEPQTWHSRITGTSLVSFTMMGQVEKIRVSKLGRRKREERTIITMFPVVKVGVTEKYGVKIRRYKNGVQ